MFLMQNQPELLHRLSPEYARPAHRLTAMTVWTAPSTPATKRWTSATMPPTMQPVTMGISVMGMKSAIRLRAARTEQQLSCADDGLFCNGTESCNEAKDSCASSGNPCNPDTTVCNEKTDTCDPLPEGCKSDAECDDGIFCNGVETCNAYAKATGERPRLSSESARTESRLTAMTVWTAPSIPATRQPTPVTTPPTMQPVMMGISVMAMRSAIR